MRLFIAMYLNHDLVREFLQNIKKELQGIEGRIKFVEPENIHVTLQFLGEVLPQTKPLIEEALSEIQFPRFEYSIEGVGFFKNRYGDPRVIWCGLHRGKEYFENLATMIHGKMKPIGFIPDKPFKPHVTIARVKSPIKPKKRFREIMEKYKTIKIDQGTMEKFSLVQSTLTPQGPIYETIKEFQLHE